MREIILQTFFLLFFTTIVQSQNPIYDGMPTYGIRDCHIICDGGKYYLTGTEVASPGEPKEGINLYVSSNLKRWEKHTLLINRDDIDSTSPYRDGFDSPEITKIDNRYILTFGGRNNDVNPYAPTQIVLAESKKVTGPYKVITPNTLIRANRFTLFQDDDQQTYAYWELDGSLYGAKMSSSLTQLASEPQLLLKPRQLRKDDRFLDSPSMIKMGDTYHLVYTVFKGGYYATFATSDSPLGPWKGNVESEIFYRTEDQAPTVLRAQYENYLVFAPPCEIIGNVQFLQDKKGDWFIVYHSEDKYAEPFLCIDKAQVKENKITTQMTLP